MLWVLILLCVCCRSPRFSIYVLCCVSVHPSFALPSWTWFGGEKEGVNSCSSALAERTERTLDQSGGICCCCQPWVLGETWKSEIITRLVQDVLCARLNGTVTRSMPWWIYGWAGDVRFDTSHVMFCFHRFTVIIMFRLLNVGDCMYRWRLECSDYLQQIMSASAAGHLDYNREADKRAVREPKLRKGHAND